MDNPRGGGRRGRGGRGGSYQQQAQGKQGTQGQSQQQQQQQQRGGHSSGPRGGQHQGTQGQPQQQQQQQQRGGHSSGPRGGQHRGGWSGESRGGHQQRGGWSGESRGGHQQRGGWSGESRSDQQRHQSHSGQQSWQPRDDDRSGASSRSDRGGYRGGRGGGGGRGRYESGASADMQSSSKKFQPSTSKQSKGPLLADKLLKETREKIRAEVQLNENALQIMPKGGDVDHSKSKYVETKKPVVEVNFVTLKMKNTQLVIYHYDVKFTIIRDKKEQSFPVRFCRIALSRLINREFGGRNLGFDGKQNLYAGGRRLFDARIGEMRTFDNIVFANPEEGKDITCRIVIQFANELNVSQLYDFIRNRNAVVEREPLSVITSLDILLRQPFVDDRVFAGPSFYLPQDEYPLQQGTEPWFDLTGGFELGKGIFQSAVMGSNDMYLNVDVAHKAFPRAQSILDYLKFDLPKSLRRGRSFDPLPQIDLNRALEYNALDVFERFIRGLKVDYERPGGVRSRNKVDAVDRNASDTTFDYNNSVISVSNYFKNVLGIELRYPHLPVLVSIKRGPTGVRHLRYPIELCRIAPNQCTAKKLDDEQTRAMVGETAGRPDERKIPIMNHLRTSDYRNELGITVGKSLVQVQTHVLKAPTIKYANGTAFSENGSWNMARGTKFEKCVDLNRWGIYVLDRQFPREDVIRGKVTDFKRMAAELGIRCSDPETIHYEQRLNETSIENRLREYEEKSYQLVLVIVKSKPSDAYGMVKRASELRTGVLTQCILVRTFERNFGSATVRNIFLKINSKLGGLNHTIKDPGFTRPRILNTNEHVMIVGADVTHPTPGSREVSIAAVTASYDGDSCKYRMTYRLQVPRVEMIVKLDDMMLEHLKYYKEKNGAYPNIILYYRDGVSDGQLITVLVVEMSRIRIACKKLGINPAITFLVVRKRHHARFFPINARKGDNVCPGTLVDTDIVHPKEVEFYLVSHQAIKGTARPTKYTLLWDDNKFQTEDLERLTYYLCHLYVRCNRSVSYPAPTYYAHHAAFRAREYWAHREVNLEDLDRERITHGQIVPQMDRTPMHFV